MLSECSAKRASRAPRRSPRLCTEGFHSPTSSVVLEEEQLSSYVLKNKQHDMMSFMMISSNDMIENVSFLLLRETNVHLDEHFVLHQVFQEKDIIVAGPSA